MTPDQACHGKLPYETWAKAHTRRLKANHKASRGSRVQIYRCPRCRFWHVGGTD